MRLVEIEEHRAFLCQLEKHPLQPRLVNLSAVARTAKARETRPTAHTGTVVSVARRLPQWNLLTGFHHRLVCRREAPQRVGIRGLSATRRGTLYGHLLPPHHGINQLLNPLA